VNLSARIHKAAQDKTLSLMAAMEIASDYRLSLSEVEKTALRLHIWPVRYQGHTPEMTPDDQIRLLESTVLIAGCGGTGGHAAALLARMGTGRLILVDPDRFDESNLNRQMFCSIDTLGVYKTVAAADAISRINPAVVTTSVTEPVEESGRLLTGSSIVLDCLDNAGSRLRLASMCREAGVPLIHGAAGMAMGQVAVELPHTAIMEHLYPHGTTADTTRHSTFSFSVAVVASMQCAEVWKLLLNRPSRLMGTWAFIDILEIEAVIGPEPV